MNRKILSLLLALCLLLSLTACGDAEPDAPDVPDVSEEERPVADAIPPEPEENQEPDQSQSNEEATD